MIMKTTTIAAALGVFAVLAVTSGTTAAERTVIVPMPAVDVVPAGNRAIAVLAGGCFWGMEAVFSHLNGVTSVVSGYAGGTANDATYDKVSSETTRHAEAIRIT